MFIVNKSPYSHSFYAGLMHGFLGKKNKQKSFERTNLKVLFLILYQQIRLHFTLTFRYCEHYWMNYNIVYFQFILYSCTDYYDNNYSMYLLSTLLIGIKIRTISKRHPLVRSLTPERHNKKYVVVKS